MCASCTTLINDFLGVYAVTGVISNQLAPVIPAFPHQIFFRASIAIVVYLREASSSAN